MNRELSTCNQFVDKYISSKPFPFRTTLCNCLQSTGVPMGVVNHEFIKHKKDAIEITDDPVQIRKLRECVDVYIFND